VLHPVDDLAVERFRNRNMRHRCGRRRAVPVLLARREPDDITRPDLLDRPTLALREAAAGRYDPVCPSGCVCQAVRAPGSNVTLAPLTRAGSGALNSGSMRTVPVNHSAGPLPDGCVPFRLISIALAFQSVVT
jgi:hypothetical protein